MLKKSGKTDLPEEKYKKKQLKEYINSEDYNDNININNY